nr:retrovirus-related Pol polyprotein from transposon TNT 1-94 [Tanacetum cinerariifolium]
MNQFCDMKRIKREFSIARTPQQNGVAERKNKTLIEAARTMLVDSKLPTTFWAEAVNTACYVINRALVIKPYNKTPYELIYGRHPLIDFMKPFGYPVTILNTRDSLGKFNEKANEGFFVRFLKNAPNVKGNGPDWIFDIDSLTISMNYEPVVAGKQTNGIAGTKDNIVTGSKDSAVDAGKKATEVDESRLSDNGGQDDQVTRCEFEGLLQQERQTKHINSTNSFNIVASPINTAGPSFDNTASPSHINAAGTPANKWAIGTKWVFRNKKDERCIVVKNKARLVTQGHAQEEGIDYDEVSTPVARIEAIRLFLAYASFKDFVVYQMDVKSSFLYGKIEEEVYVCQPPGFEDPNFPDKIYKVEKALYGLHQAPRAWPDITFAVCACARFQVTLKTSHLYVVKRIFRYLKGQPKLGLWYPRDSPFYLEAYSDNDYVGASLDRKSTTGGCQFLGKKLISWQCKKQTIVANSTTKAEYVHAASYCGQVLWIQNQLLDYGFNLMNTKIYIDNESTICIVKNPVFHSKTKHIEIRNHFIIDSYEKKLFQVIKIHTDHNVADHLTKAFDVGRFNFLAYTYCCQMRVNAAKNKLTTTGNGYAAEGKKVNGQDHIQALVDKQKVIITEESIRRDLKFNDAEGTVSLPNDTIFDELARISSTMSSAIICLANNQKFNFSKYIFDNIVKHLEGGVKFLMFSRFLQVFLDKQVEGMAKYKEIYVISSHTKKKKWFSTLIPITPTNTQPSSSKPQKKIKPKRKQRQATKFYSPSSEIPVKESIPTHFNDPLPSGEDSIQLNELIIFCTNLQQQEDASKQERSIEDIDQDAEIALVDEAQGRMHDADMFGVDDLEGNEVIIDVREEIFEKEVNTADPVTTAGEVVTTASVEDSAAPTTATTADVDDELCVGPLLNVSLTLIQI